MGTKTPLAGQNLGSDRDAHQVGPRDDVLIERCRGGNMDAFGQLIERYQDRLYNAIVRVVGSPDDALELTQDAFVRALQGLSRFRQKSSFYTWLFRIGINLSINHRKRRERVRFTSLNAETADGQAAGLAQWVQSDQPAPEERVQLQEDYQRTLQALEALEAEARAVVVLRDIEELSYAQISRILDVPVGTVKSRLFRARMTLREKLQ